jgi:hypothetical protein
MESESQRARSAAEFCGEQTFHRREWFVQRIAWALLVAVVVAAVTGVFGDGPLANARVAIGDGQVHYERFVRKRAGTEWRIKPARDTALGIFRVGIDASLLDHYEVISIVPEPQATHLAFGKAVYEFDLGSAPADVVFHLEPERVGRALGEMRLGNSSSTVIKQFVLP